MKKAAIAPVFAACVICFCFLSGNPVFAQNPAPQKATGATLTIEPAEPKKPWTGDLDGMIGRRIIRVLMVYSKTFYFMTRACSAAPPRTWFGCSRTTSTRSSPPRRNSRTRTSRSVYFHPRAARRIAAGARRRQGRHCRRQSHHHAGAPETGGLLVGRPDQRERGRRVGPRLTAVASLDDLSGKEVFVRKSSSYYESLVDLNKKFASGKKPPVS